MNKKQLLYLSGVISADKLLKEETENYMFFQNLQTMKSCIDELLDMNESDIDAMLSKHDWASDHVSSAKTSLEQVCDWIKNSIDKNESVFDQLNTSKFEFTIPKENLPKLKSFLKSIKAHIEITNSNRGEGTVDGVIRYTSPAMEGGEKAKEILQSIKDAIAKAKRYK
jgi:translation initiation factor 2 alpha subunit (eIF-2alpha)